MVDEARDDRALVERANAGEEAAFEGLYEAHRAWVLALATRFTGNREDALDVLQETFVELFSRFPGFRLTSSLRAYLFPVVKHRSISLMRKRRPVVDLDHARGRAARAAPTAQWPGETAGAHPRLIAGLPAAQREVLGLRFVLDLRLSEIADALAIPLGTVKSRLHTALAALRRNSPREE